MIKSIIYLILFSASGIWAVVDLIRAKHKNFDKEYRDLYVQNKILLAILFFAVAMMQAEKIWNF